MSILLDECMPFSLTAALRAVGRDVFHLLEFSEPQFRYFITEDKNFVSQSGIFSKRPDFSVLRIQAVTLRRPQIISTFQDFWPLLRKKNFPLKQEKRFFGQLKILITFHDVA